MLGDESDIGEVSPWLQCEDEGIGGRGMQGSQVAGFAQRCLRLMEAGPGAVGGK